MVDYSPLGNCIFNEVFVIDLGNDSVPKSPFLLFFCDTQLEFVCLTEKLTHSRAT